MSGRAPRAPRIECTSRLTSAYDYPERSHGVSLLSIELARARISDARRTAAEAEDRARWSRRRRTRREQRKRDNGVR
jgi:hypothetical protein